MPNFANHESAQLMDQNRYTDEDGGLLDLATIRAFLWRQRWVLLIVTGLFLLGGLIFTMLATPVYSATATVRIDPQNTEVIDGQDLIDPYIASNEISRYIDTLSNVLQSRSMALKVVDDLDLDENAAFLDFEPGQATTAANREQRRNAAAGKLRGGVSIEVPINTRIMEITYSSTDPQMAARVANGYVQNFLLDDVARSFEANAYAKQFLEERIAESRARLRGVEVGAINYARSNRIIGQASTGGEGGEDVGTAPTLTVSNLTGVSEQLVTARGRRIAAEQRWRESSARPAGQLAEVRANPAIQSLQARLTELNSQLADLRQRYRDDYPAIREKLAEIATLETDVNEAGTQIKAGIRSEYNIALREEQALERELSQASSETLDEQDRRVQYNLINRDVDAERMQLEALLQRYNEVSAVANFRSSDLAMLDEALVPGRPSSPNLFTNMILALVMGLGLATALAVMREMFDDRLRSIEDVERKLKLTSLGQVPNVGTNLEEELATPFSPISEAYSSIRATLDFALPPGGHQVLQFTSGQPGEGKTTSAIAVARKYASLGRKVLLVDLDLRRPSVGKGLGLARVKHGVIDVLYSRVSLAEAVAVDPVSGLKVLSVSEIPLNPVEVLSSGLVPEFIARHRNEFDVIIFDSSPVLGIADAPLLSRYVDAVVFIVEANRASFGQTRMAVRRLRDVGGRLLGAMVTKYKSLDAGENYNYQYRYYRYGDAEN